MSFTQLIFLFGALAVVGPLIAHLLAKPKFRRLPFTMLRFLRVGQIESQARRRFRDLLILLLRCAIIVLIAMLFARPRLLREPVMEEPQPVHYLGLDNSMSMAYSDGSGSYFKKLVRSAADYIRSADDNALFNICTLSSGTWAKGLSKELALAEVKRLKIVPKSANIKDFLSLPDSAGRKGHLNSEVSVLLLSDFTPNTLKQFVDIDEPVTVDNISCKPIVSPEPVNNAAVIDAHVGSVADGKLTINVAVINYGRVEQNRRLTAQIGENKSAPVDVKLLANQRRIYPVEVDVDTTGQGQLFLPVQLSLSAADGLKQDDTFYLAVSLPRQKKLNVLLIGSGRGETFLLKTAMNALSQMDSYDTVNVKQISYGDFNVSDLDWADVIVCSAITVELSNMAQNLKSFVRAGGKTIFFMTDNPAPKVAKLLWRQDILPAMPGRCIRRRAYIQRAASDSQPLGMESDAVAVKSLSNYRIDKIVLTGYFECEQHHESICAWRLQNGFGFVYFKRLGNGTAILVNTSADDSLGALTKSNAIIAFCRYLLGQNTQISEHSFACDEQVVLPASDMEIRFAGQKQFWVENCDGRKSQAEVVESFLLVPEPAGIGWIKTLTRPTRYAGINLPDGETDMTAPTDREVANVISRAFSTQAKRSPATAEAFSDKDYKPIWKLFAWVIIVLLLVEPAIANRLKR